MRDSISFSRTAVARARLTWLSMLFAIVLGGGFATARSLAAGQAAALKIVVLEGENGVNIIEQKTAVAPLVEVRDRNDLPVVGASVTFLIRGGGSNAALNSGLQQVTLTTNTFGQATVSVNPLTSGTLQIQVNAAYQGQTAAATISQTNYATAAQAAQAANAAGGAGSSSSGGSSAGGSSAGGGGAAGGGSSTAGAVGGAAGGAGGGMGAGATALVVGGVAAGGIVGGKYAYDAIKEAQGSDAGSRCTAQETALENGGNAFSNQLNSYVTCVNNAQTNAQINACQAQFNTAFQTYLNLASEWCTCLGPSATAELTPEDRAIIRDLFNQLRQMGFNPGNLPSCYQ